ncbi:MAG: DUF6174 domain-containing protein [Nocardioidaceae bacterium]|nr:DUF6174 domain-containing protein [Nocardioidaceae bacterium]
MKRIALVTLILSSPLVACSTTEETRPDSNPSSATPSAPGETTSPAPNTSTGDQDSATTAPTKRPGSLPAFAPTDYTYRLQVLCFCPQVGAVRVEVASGKVTKATALTGRFRGKPAPSFTRLSINDIIDQANEPHNGKVKVVWPPGQEHPTSVRIDRIPRATDDEVTYLIKKVMVNGG